MQTERIQLARDALRRFAGLSESAIARYILVRNSDLFKSFEAARSAIRQAKGTKADVNRDARSLRHRVMQSMAAEREAYVLPPGRWGVLADVHVPFHRPKPLEAALQWMKHQKVTGLLFMGDFQDCAAVSYWRDTRRPDFQKEVEQTIDMLDLIKAEFPKAPIVWQRGNHEDRVENYYRANAPELCDLPTAGMDEILRMHERNIHMTERKQKIQAHELTILHGHEMKGSYSPVSPARWLLNKAKACCVIGHFHKPSEDAARQLDGKVVGTWSVGCLCDLEPDYNPFGNQWSWGCALLDLRKDGWEFDNHKILNNGKVV